MHQGSVRWALSAVQHKFPVRTGKPGSWLFLPRASLRKSVGRLEGCPTPRWPIHQGLQTALSTRVSGSKSSVADRNAFAHEGAGKANPKDRNDRPYSVPEAGLRGGPSPAQGRRPRRSRHRPVPEFLPWDTPRPIPWRSVLRRGRASKPPGLFDSADTIRRIESGPVRALAARPGGGDHDPHAAFARPGTPVATPHPGPAGSRRPASHDWQTWELPPPANRPCAGSRW